MYVDDVIIIGDTTKKIDGLIQALHGGDENFDFTEKGSIDKYLGVEIKQLGKDSFKISKPCLIKRVLALLGIEQNTTNEKLTPVGKSLPNKDLIERQTVQVQVELPRSDWHAHLFDWKSTPINCNGRPPMCPVFTKSNAIE